MLIVDDSSDPRKNRLQQYRKKIAVMPLETPRQYRSRVGRISKHRYLMDNRPAPAQRKAEIEIYHETVERVTAKHKQMLADIKDNSPSFREKQIAYDKSRGAYKSRIFLEVTQSMTGMEE